MALFSGQGDTTYCVNLGSGDLQQLEFELEQALICEMDCACYDKNGNSSDDSSDSGDEPNTSSKTSSTIGSSITTQDGWSAAALLHITKEVSSDNVADKSTLTITDDALFPSVSISLPGIFKAQMLAYAASPLGQLGVQNMTAAAGFSQGMLAALVLSAGCDSPAAFKLCARCATTLPAACFVC